MTALSLRDALEPDFPHIVALNASVVQDTSAMDLQRLRLLHSLRFRHRVAEIDGRVVAFLLTMRDGAAYENDNFAWFSARYPQFVYVDRIVVASAAAGIGVGRRLYEDLFVDARREGIDIVACEYNLEPPNPASRAFHDRFGFREVGQQHVAGGSKRVSLQITSISEHRAS